MILSMYKCKIAKNNPTAWQNYFLSVIIADSYKAWFS